MKKKIIISFCSRYFGSAVQWCTAGTAQRALSLVSSLVSLGAVSGMEHEQESEAAGAAAGESAPSAEAAEAAAFVAAGGARRAAPRAPTIDARATAKPVIGAGKVQPKKRAAVGAAAGAGARPVQPACSKPPARVRKRTKRAATGGATAGELCDDPLDDRGRGEEGEEEEEDEPLPDDRGARKMCWAMRVVSLGGLGSEQSFSAYPFYGDGEAEVGAEWQGTDRQDVEEMHVRNGAEETKLGSSSADLQQFDEHSADVRAANEKLHDDHEAELQVLTHDSMYCRR